MANKFPYENLNNEEFENLVIRISKEIFGMGCKTFSTGRDGAKDSWFEGTANRFPSDTDPWAGKTNIQAKHTTILNASCSDNDFSVNKTSVLAKEIERLRETIQEPFDNYVIFTNRKLSGEAHSSIVKTLRDRIGIKNVDIIGREQIDAYLTDYPQIANQFGLDKFLAPLRFYEKDLQKVIIVFSEQRKAISTETKDYLTSYPIIDKERKNELNNLSKEYFDFIKNRSLQYFEEIESFLQNPKNESYTKMYSNTVSDLQASIILERNKFTEFERVIEHIVNILTNNNDDKLKDLREIIRVFVHFMYFNCDIGRAEP
ncbi:MAG: hypothetical protein LBR10_13330 [Prevotellaceae bacterium]|jgi:hypothetical protein|nr:hypothetical protein [Prevotellaceae bacterium]